MGTPGLVIAVALTAATAALAAAGAWWYCSLPHVRRRRRLRERKRMIEHFRKRLPRPPDGKPPGPPKE